MAINGSVSQTLNLIGLYGKSYSVTFTLHWLKISHSVENNSSTIQWWVDAIYHNGYKIGTDPNNTDYYKVVIDGTPYSGNYPFNNASAGELRELVSGTAVIPHNADGTKTFSYSHKHSAYVAASSTGTLDTIPRPASITSAADFNDEENPTITYNNISGELVDALEACISLTGAADDVPYRAISKTDSSYTFELTNSERNTLRSAITSGNSTTVRFYVRTTIGDYVKHSFITKTLTLVDYEPVLTPIVADINPDTLALTGDENYFIRNYSNAEVTFYAVARKGSTVAGKSVTNGSQSLNIEDANQDSIVVNKVDGDTFYLSVTDSRGHSTLEELSLGDNFIPYFNVTCNQTIRLNLDGTITLTAKGKYFDGYFGEQDNELIIETRHNEDGGEWSEWGAITPLISEISNDTYTLSATISGYDPSGSYGFQCRARDKLSTAESAIDTITLKPIFDWGRNDFNFNVPVTIEGEPLTDFVVEEGTEDMGTNGTWYWSKWKSGKAECYGCRNYGNMAVSTAWGSLYRSGTFTQFFPAGLFAATPEVIDITLRSTGNYGGWIVRHEESAPSDYDTGSFIIVRPASANLTQAYISFHIIGRWK